MRRTLRSLAHLLIAATVTTSALLVPQSAQAAEDPIAGAQTSGDVLFPNVGNGGYDVQHYDIDLAWTPGATLATSTIDAITSIQATTTGAPLSSYSLDFEGPALVVSSVTVNGEPAEFTRDENPAAIRHKLIVTPATPVDGAFSTVVTYAGIPNRHVDADGSFEGWNVTNDGATFLNQPIGAMTAFPNNNTPSDKATYTLDIDIPNTITNTAGTGSAAAASNGELADKVANGADRTTWRWVQQEQMATELVMISIGKYDVLESDVTLASGRTLHEWSFVDSAISATTKNNINIQRARQKPIIDGLETRFGPYPGNSIGAVVDIVPSGINYALETQDRSFFPSSISANTLVHEIAHQWYGNNVSPKVWNDIWINEGMGTWAPTHYNNVLANPPTSTNSTHSAYYTSWNNTAPTSSSWTTPPAGMTNSANLYGYQTYTRSAQMYEALRLSIGDADFFEFLREWQVRYGGESRGQHDFIVLAEEISGRDLEAFFQDWIYDADKPAWPQRHDLSLASSPTEGPLNPGDTVTYTLTAANQGRVALTTTKATVDLSDVLDDATIDPAALPAELTLDGSTLTWNVPTTAPATFATGADKPTTPTLATVSFPVVVDAATSQADLVATATPETLGGFCVPDGCSSTLGVPIQPVTPAADPTVTGTPAVGETLTAVTDGWAEGTTFAYQWSVGDAPVDGATDTSYTPVSGDVGETITVTVTGSKDGYTDVTRTSGPTDEVALGVIDGATPGITGTPQVDVELTAVPGDWDDDVTLAYQWLVGGDEVDGATSSTFTPRPGDAGKTVAVTVTGSKTGYADASRTSDETDPVALGVLTGVPAPTTGGTPQVGKTVSVDTGTWDSAPSVQWLRDGHVIEGADGTSYDVVAADNGRVLTARVTYARAGYADEVRRASTEAVAPGELTLRPKPRIGGKPKVGNTLRARTGEHDPGVTPTVYWKVGGKLTNSGPILELLRKHRGDRVRIVVIARKPGYTPVRLVSARTERVR